MRLGDFYEESSKLPSNRALYASFVQFLNASSVSDSSNSITNNLKVKADTNFISNFPHDIIATPIHAAPLAHSYALQYLGKYY
jgi:hypothetical protein